MTPYFLPSGWSRPALRRRGTRRFAATAAIAVAIALAGSAPGALAFGFGNPQVQSALGEALRLRIPVLADADVELTPQCLRLVNDADDPLPTISALSGTQVRIEGRGADRVLEIESRYPVNEPLVHLIIEAGCAEPVRREFTVLLDPPASPRNPAASTAAPVRVAAVPPPPDLSLGMPRVFAQVGRPLAMQIPVGGSAAATLPLQCVHLTDALSGDGAPVIHHADILIAHEGGRTEIRLVTPHPVTEPAVRVAVSVGCTSPLQREYGVLLDMPAAPAVAPRALAAATLPAATAHAGGGPGGSNISRPRHRQAAVSRHVVRRHPVHHAWHPAMASHARPAPAHPRALAAAAPHAPALPRRPHPEAFRTQDRLVLAAAPADVGIGNATPDAPPDRMAVMGKQISDLTQQIRILQTELAADRARERQQTARELALQSQLAAQERSSGLAWVAAAAIAAALIAAGVLFWIRRQGDRDGRRRTWDAIVPNAMEPETADFAASAWSGRRTAPPQPAASAPSPILAQTTLQRGEASPERPVPRAAPAAPPPSLPVPPMPDSAAATHSSDDLADDHPVLARSTPHRIEVVELHHPTAHRTETAIARPEDIPGAGASPEPAAGHEFEPAPDPWRDLDEEIPLDSGPPSILGAHPAAPQANAEADIPLTQMPTMLSLDLDLSTDLTLLSDLEPGKRG